MPRSMLLAVVLIALPLAAAPKRRSVVHPSSPAVTRASVSAVALRIIDGVQIPAHEPRLHWENAPYLDGTLLVAEELQRADLIDRVAAVILGSNDNIESISWGDGTAFSQAALDLYRVLPPGDARRDSLLALFGGSMAFAQHAIRDSPDTTAARNPWWVEGGYGVRYWQDDMYMVIPWLAMYGSARDGLPANAQARDLAYEWIEAYVYDHRDARHPNVPSARERSGLLLWDPQHALFQHAPETIGSDEFWGRGNGWSLLGLARAAEVLDAPYAGNRYATTLTAAEIRVLLADAAASIVQKRTPSGGWPSSLSHVRDCPVFETSATGLLIAFLARGVNDGWLDRDKYVPVILQAFALLMDRVDAGGVVHDIQPPGTGPAFCGAPLLASNDPAINMNYGPGAVLLAAAEILKLREMQ
jgi:rhamnogalacturonyl hydrolase YesR